MTTSLQQLFSATTIQLEHVESYLLSVPGNLEAGYEAGVSPEARRLLFRTDNVEFELRQHLAGETRTKHPLNRAIRSFLAFDELSAQVMIDITLEAVKMTLLANEWYELLPRYQRIRQHIQKTFSI